jgi:hypothetical protein
VHVVVQPLPASGDDATVVESREKDGMAFAID